MKRVIQAFKKNWKRSKSNSFILLSLAIILTCICLGVERPQTIKAQELPKESVKVTTSSWKYATFPIENFQGYTSFFGYRVDPITGKQQFHNGLDLAAPLGSYVRNWWAGQIVELSDNTNCGTSITIQSGHWQHIYCHLIGHVESNADGRYLIDRHGGIQLWEGQIVPSGERIARVGMTGRTTGPHLHWGLIYNDSYIDPAVVIRQMNGEGSKS
ncbi:MAG: M23 family metallopeptidase [Gomphosphaeria aponina SAG 52.96 = DSM 107014]|uniref:M23 family metallopeptidase n=1 Tax=Gomphosphaeria aponina SAG 52.96 = DSM 107014 TaxID=1521640 RepID=A0A941GVB8_9CHRO|nr:M23 family metallopeptidase [Gomphosphaeria aponina SAG 52.96 = DSM 107014]